MRNIIIKTCLIFSMFFLVLSLNMLKADAMNDDRVALKYTDPETIKETNYINYAYEYNGKITIGNITKYNHHDDIYLIDEDINIFKEVINSCSQGYKYSDGKIVYTNKIKVLFFSFALEVEKYTTEKITILLSMSESGSEEWHSIGGNSFKVDQNGYYHFGIAYDSYENNLFLGNKLRIMYRTQSEYCYIKSVAFFVNYRYFISDSDKSLEKKQICLPIIQLEAFEKKKLSKK